MTMIFAEPAFLDAAVSELSLKEQARFWKEVEKGAKRNLMRIQRAELDEKIKAMDAGE
ncbi:hypothetical protein [Bauldia litoralis]|uniref:hypothetical protein n=1 Tax=Bauldia litoralis TaxID=665467 RepID=UPI003262DFCD